MDDYTPMLGFWFVDAWKLPRPENTGPWFYDMWNEAQRQPVTE